MLVCLLLAPGTIVAWSPLWERLEASVGYGGKKMQDRQPGRQRVIVLARGFLDLTKAGVACAVGRATPAVRLLTPFYLGQIHHRVK